MASLAPSSIGRLFSMVGEEKILLAGRRTQKADEGQLRDDS